jgi:hypothetical protein
MPPDKLEAALEVAEEVLSGISLGTLSITAASLRCLHLARLVGDASAEEWLSWESFGYPRTPQGHIQSHAFQIASSHGRELARTDDGSRRIFTELAGELESAIDANKRAIGIVTTSGVSVSGEYLGGALRALAADARTNARNHIDQISTAERKLTILRGQYYGYASAVSIELRFSGRAEEVFRNYRAQVDRRFLDLAPESLKRLDAAYERLSSSNPESWAQAVSSCRRVFEELANALYKSPEGKYKTSSGKELDVSGDKYKNRLFALIDQVANSRSTRRFVGSNAMYVIDFVDELHGVLNRGVHKIDDPLHYEEARAALLHTYILLGDIANLLEDNKTS